MKEKEMDVKTVTRKISRETAAEWGLPEYHSMTPPPQCEVCKDSIEWIDCPTGSWWAHWEHPADEHDAVHEDPVEGRAVFLETDHIESHRFQEEWSMVFVAPDDGQAWEVTYWVPSGEGEADVWNDAAEVELTLVNRVKVVKYEWHTVKVSAH
jgi:hypothetical protein